MLQILGYLICAMVALLGIISAQLGARGGIASKVIGGTACLGSLYAAAVGAQMLWIQGLSFPSITGQ